MRKRKVDHIRICLNQEVETGLTGFGRYRFVHKALPEVDFKKINTSTRFLGKKLSAPILISPMTGGTTEAGKMNKNLAKAAQKIGVAMAVGSQRIAIENPKKAFTFQVRNVASDILLFANLGAVQLNYGYGIKKCQKAVEMIGANALFFHLNPLQEVIQPEGNTNFGNLLSKIEKIARDLSVPVIVKEVGGGISEEVARRLYQSGIRIIDTAGWGGTNWAKIEGIRAKNRLGEIFSQWGIPTADSIIQCRKIKGLKIIGSGGIRNGIEIAKAIALGADLVGLALPFLKPAIKSEKAVEEKLIQLIKELKIVMFCTGVKNLSELKTAQLINLNGSSEGRI